MRNACYGVIVIVLLATAVGCAGPKFVSRSYALGPRPKATVEIINWIVSEQGAEHAEAMLEHGFDGKRVIVLKAIPEEGVVIVRTTRQGHRQIEAAVQELEEGGHSLRGQ